MKYSYVLDGIIKMSFLSVFFAILAFVRSNSPKHHFIRRETTTTASTTINTFQYFILAYGKFSFYIYYSITCAVLYSHKKYTLIQIGQYLCKYFAEYSIATHKTIKSAMKITLHLNRESIF